MTVGEPERQSKAGRADNRSVEKSARRRDYLDSVYDRAARRLAVRANGRCDDEARTKSASNPAVQLRRKWRVRYTGPSIVSCMGPPVPMPLERVSLRRRAAQRRSGGKSRLAQEISAEKAIAAGGR